MNIQKNSEYIRISATENTFESFLNDFKKKHSEYIDQHVIVELSDNINISVQDILVFLSYAQEHLHNGTSFVVVYKDVDIDEIPETLNVVPTLVEAEDVIEMENIQRDLGF